MRIRYLLFLLIQLTLFYPAFSFDNPQVVQDTSGNFREKINYLKQYFSGDGGWMTTDPAYAKNVEQLIRFIEAQPIDTILKYFQNENKPGIAKVLRLPEYFSDTLQIPGYITYRDMMRTVAANRRSMMSEVQRKNSEIQAELLQNIESKVSLVPPGQGSRLFSSSVYTLPDSLKVPEIIPETMLNSSEDFQRFQKLDSLRSAFIEQKRIHYNDSVVGAYIDSVLAATNNIHAEDFIREQVKEYVDSVLQNNANLVQEYNGYAVSMANDTISAIISELIGFANRIDSAAVNLQNLDGRSEALVLGGFENGFTRIWLKNRQNDSLSVVVEDTGKRSLKMLIDDNATINRFVQQQAKEFSFRNFTPSSNLANVKQRYKLETPWNIGGDGNIGFTQTYLSNWSKGGKSAVSMLLVLKGFANYTTLDGKVKWENSGEIRNGWLRTGSDEAGKKYESQKNDDKFEIISRIGISAFKKWYYSAEIDFETQLFYGYKYPVTKNPDPISGFLSPAKTLFKIGLDYKPNSKFSLFLSPLTSKSVFIRDTARINTSSFNIPAGKRTLWVPGLNADLTFKTNLMENITWETKYKMFVNYTAPFEKFDINWENLVVMKVNDYIDVRLMLHMIYDDDVLFTVKENGVDVKKPRLQVKELITVGFSYKINRKVLRTRQVI